MPSKEFLENYPLYKKFVTGLNPNLHNFKDLRKPSVHLHCEHCDSEQTFNMVNNYDEVDYYNNNIAPDVVVRAKYQCFGCHEFIRYFFIRFGKDILEEVDENGEKRKKDVIYVQKVGQHPAWSIEMDKQLEKELGKHSDFYKRGLICESQGYGIGAFAYYRRITETIIDQLLDSIEDLLEGEEKTQYKKALAQTKETTITQNKIELVKDLLPVSLRPEGMNPLSVLHSALSEGLHAETDEACLDYAEEIKSALVYLVNQVERSKNSSKSFTESMRKLLEKRAGIKKGNTEN